MGRNFSTLVGVVAAAAVFSCGEASKEFPSKDISEDVCWETQPEGEKEILYDSDKKVFMDLQGFQESYLLMPRGAYVRAIPPINSDDRTTLIMGPFGEERIKSVSRVFDEEEIILKVVDVNGVATNYLRVPCPDN